MFEANAQVSAAYEVLNKAFIKFSLAYSEVTQAVKDIHDSHNKETP